MKCPCGKEITERLKFGIRTYRHADGKACPMMNTSALSLNRLHKTTLENRKPELDSLYVMAGIREPEVAAYFLTGIENESDPKRVYSILKKYEEKKLWTCLLLDRFTDHFGRFAQVLLNNADVDEHVTGPTIYRNKPKCLEGSSWAPQDRQTEIQDENGEIMIAPWHGVELESISFPEYWDHRDHKVHTGRQQENKERQEFEEARKKLRDMVEEWFQKRLSV